jgi:acetolactate synthase I/II/III large subunit
MGGMGYSIAAAVGAQLGSAGARSLVLCGDGAFLMLGLEVHTAVERRLPILFVVFNNGGHGMCTTRQRLFFDGRTACADYPAVAIATLARGLGDPSALWTARATTPAELDARLAEYPADRPGVLELEVTDEIPPFTPFLPADAPTETAPQPSLACATRGGR